MAALGATLGVGEGCCCAAGSLAVFAMELSADAKVWMPQRQRKTRTSVVLLVAFLIRD
jgi:uncharacterized protein YaeQ